MRELVTVNERLVFEVLGKYDPADFGEDFVDEYDVEAKDIARDVGSVGSVEELADLICQRCQHWFKADRVPATNDPCWLLMATEVFAGREIGR